MTAKPPPVPPAQQSKKGPAGTKRAPTKAGPRPSRPDNPEEQGKEGNIVQNTHHQGYQQDR
jgi:hypothetical protein